MLLIVLSVGTNGTNGIFCFILCWELGSVGFCIVVCCVDRCKTQDVQQSLVGCVGCCCSVLELLSLQQNVTGSRAHTNVFTEQIKAGEKKGRASKWLWVFFKW